MIKIEKLQELLSYAVKLNASDIHLVVGNKPIARINGAFFNLSNEIITQSDTNNFARCILKEEYEIYNDTGEIDVCYSIINLSRFRINIFKQQQKTSLAIRVIPSKVYSLDELMLPKIIKDVSNEKRGLILITGPTGSGKSTTVSAIIDEINKSRCAHILTLEDPIEFVHKSKKSIINQREIGKDTKNYENALKAGLREDPDVIFIGEMRDIETISIAIRAAETGHLVISTLHTLGADVTVDRIVDVFPANQQNQIKMQLSFILKAIISQQLVETVDEKRILALELMLNIPSIANLIREGKTHQIKYVIQTNMNNGMKSMDYSIVNLLKNKKITIDTALKHCVDKENIKKYI